ncbi:Uncharacterized protein dnm_070900 [Desulfonema magnum]|uniref:Uncharacterized protein n=1 Tax=Desulfonema magnum TaxID=45655 RepID=A0A975BSU5_9BACT|nr:Uncharacterized protein dnm_070900 [Desulfonema magnum]
MKKFCNLFVFLFTILLKEKSMEASEIKCPSATEFIIYFLTF